MHGSKVRRTMMYRSVQTVCTGPIGDRYEWYMSFCLYAPLYNVLIRWYVLYRYLIDTLVRTDKTNHAWKFNLHSFYVIIIFIVCPSNHAICGPVWYSESHCCTCLSLIALDLTKVLRPVLFTSNTVTNALCCAILHVTSVLFESSSQLSIWFINICKCSEWSFLTQNNLSFKRIKMLLLVHKTC